MAPALFSLANFQNCARSAGGIFCNVCAKNCAQEAVQGRRRAGALATPPSFLGLGEEAASRHLRLLVAKAADNPGGSPEVRGVHVPRKHVLNALAV